MPPAAATAAREAQGRATREPPVAEQSAAAPTSSDSESAADDDDALPANAPLALGDDEFPDEILVHICSFLGPRELGRLACAARRFTEPTLTEPGGSAGGAKLLSPIEEGARLRLTASIAGSHYSGGGGASGSIETWVRALRLVEGTQTVFIIARAGGGTSTLVNYLQGNKIVEHIIETHGELPARHRIAMARSGFGFFGGAVFEDFSVRVCLFVVLLTVVVPHWSSSSATAQSSDRRTLK